MRTAPSSDSAMSDQYELVQSHDWSEMASHRQHQQYNLNRLDNDWYRLVAPHLHGSSVTDSRIAMGAGGGGKAAGVDELDAKGTFPKAEVRKELKRMNREELQDRLGISIQKVDDILRRAQNISRKAVREAGEVEYKKFLEVVREYRLNSEQESRVKNVVRVFAFVEEFSCRPPTFAMIFLTAIELGLFVYTSLHLSKEHDMAIEWDSPVPYCSYLIYNPERRWEVWRYLTYMLVHIGIGHFVFNMIMQIVVGVFLEMEQCGLLGSLKVLLVYMAGVLAGSLGTSLSDPHTFIAGASGGVYALIAAHLATMALNWQEDSSVRIKKVVHKPITRIIRLVFIGVLTLHDVGYAIYVRIYEPGQNRTGFMGHLSGALAGLLVGVFVLDNRRVKTWEPVVQWAALVIFALMVTFAVVWNIWGNDWAPGFFPDPDWKTIDDCRHYD